MEIPLLHQLFLSATSITTDTRKIEEDCLFFALKGANFNGNLFAKEALKLGAKYAIVDELTEDNNRLILVNDVLETLQQLANHHRNTLKTTFIGITGTNGKTTSKELIYAVLSSSFNTRATVGNLNNHIGVPLTLLSFNGTEEFGVIEMGANHLGEIADLCKIAEPAYGLITNIGKAHLEGFGSFENIITTKFGLYDHVNSKNGTVFINSDNEILTTYPLLRKVSYGTSQNNFCSGEVIPSSPFLKVKVNLPENTTIEIQTQLIGQYNLENVLSACCIGSYFGVSPQNIKEALENYAPSNNRSEFRKTAKNSLILDAYNANPSSMEKAIENFAELKEDNKVAILGDMFEMGDYAIQAHRDLIQKCTELGLVSLFVGKHFYENRNDKHRFFEQIEDLEKHLLENKMEHKFLLLKGSRGIKLEKILPLL